VYIKLLHCVGVAAAAVPLPLPLLLLLLLLQLGFTEQYVVGDGPLAQAVFNAEPQSVHRSLLMSSICK
jgi:hypothetical protein